MKPTPQQIDQYYADIEYDNMREEGFTSPMTRTFVEWEQRKNRELIYKEEYTTHSISFSKD